MLSLRGQAFESTPEAHFWTARVKNKYKNVPNKICFETYFVYKVDFYDCWLYVLQKFDNPFLAAHGIDNQLVCVPEEKIVENSYRMRKWAITLGAQPPKQL